MVLVCHEHKFVFLKTRKTAGTSAEMALEPFCVAPGTPITEWRSTGISKYGIVGRRGSKLTGWRKPMRLTEWCNHRSAWFVKTRLGARRWDDYRKLTIVRNPFDRMVSYFRYNHRPVLAQISDTKQIQKLFEDFIRNGRWKDDHEIVHLGDEYIIDHAIRFEHMTDDLVAVARTLGLPEVGLTIPKTKSTASISTGLDVPDYYTPATTDIVRNKLSWMFDHFDYPDTPIPKAPPPSLNL